MLIDFAVTALGVLLVEVLGLIKSPGNASTNVIIVIAHLGGRNTFMGKLDNDEFSYYYNKTTDFQWPYAASKTKKCRWKILSGGFTGVFKVDGKMLAGNIFPTAHYLW